MSKLKEGHRRSPRISALDACKNQRPRRVADGRTKKSIDKSGFRAKKIRKIKALHHVAQSHQSDNGDNDEESDEDHPHDSDQQLEQDSYSSKDVDQANYYPSVPSTTWMPEKHKLEVILDILQRRDTYEIFAEPVDPKEVEDYYDIINEPMDFGTMRAKLHEGMYSNLEQFEHDAYLISRNAMHFNSSTTMYFRQARAIYELAKKVFHAVRTNPDNFESEFTETRRRSSRRPHSESARSSQCSSSLKVSSNMRYNGVTNNESSKKMAYSSSFRKRFKGNSGFPADSTHFDTTYHEMLPGGSRRTGSFEVDRRSTYRPWTTSFFNDDDSILPTIYADKKSLMHVSREGIGYEDSLTMFVKDLGPTAKKIAERKLCGWQSRGGSHVPISYQFKPTTPDSSTTKPMSENMSGRIQGHHSMFGNADDEKPNLYKAEADTGVKARVGVGSFTEVSPNGDGKNEPQSSDSALKQPNILDFQWKNNPSSLRCLRTRTIMPSFDQTRWSGNSWGSRDEGLNIATKRLHYNDSGSGPSRGRQASNFKPTFSDT